MPFCQRCGQRTLETRTLLKQDNKTIRVCPKCIDPLSLKVCDFCLRNGHDREEVANELFKTDQKTIVATKKILYANAIARYPAITKASALDRTKFVDLALQKFTDALGDRAVYLCSDCHGKLELAKKAGAEQK